MPDPYGAGPDESPPPADPHATAGTPPAKGRDELLWEDGDAFKRDLGSVRGGESTRRAYEKFWGPDEDDPEGPVWPAPERAEPESRWRPGTAAEREPEQDDGGRVPWGSLPPSARLYGSPADPGPPGRPGGGVAWRGSAALVLALVLAAGLVVASVQVVRGLVAPDPAAAVMSDTLSGVTVTLPSGWEGGVVPPVTGFTTAARDPDGGLFMITPIEPPADLPKATREAAELYSRLLLKGDRVSVVEDGKVPGGHTLAMRAEYRDVVNRPAYLRVTLLTRAGRTAMLLGLLQPEQTGRKQALDALMSSVR